MPKLVGELTANEARIDIAREVGFKPSSMLKKEHLNSIYAYMKGEFLVDPDNIHRRNHPDYVGLKEMRLIIASLFDFHYDETKYNQEYGPRFNSQQLEMIHDGIMEHEDQRVWLKSHL